MTDHLANLQNRFAFPIAAGLRVVASACFARFLVWHLGWHFPDTSAGDGHVLGEEESILIYTLLGCALLPIAGLIATLMLSTISTVAKGRGDGVSADTLASRFDG